MLFLGLSIVAIVGAAQRPEYCGQQFSPNKIDYADPDITAPFEHVMNASACCQLCTEWNQNLTVTEGAANCTIAVWHGPGHYSCNLKHTANKPFRSSAVAAFEAYPVQPPPPPLRFSSIYTSNMVLQAAPAKPMLWGFTNTNRDDPIGMVGVSAGSGAIIRAAATLSAIPANWQPDKYADYNSIWSVKLPAVEPSFANYTFTVETASKSETAILENVVFGDVWLCGGQSKCCTMRLHIYPIKIYFIYIYWIIYIYIYIIFFSTFSFSFHLRITHNSPPCKDINVSRGTIHEQCTIYRLHRHSRRRAG